jgi:hypothetical protein
MARALSPIFKPPSPFGCCPSMSFGILPNPPRDGNGATGRSSLARSVSVNVKSYEAAQRPHRPLC